MLDSVDQLILDVLQNSFPLTLHPYEDMAKQLALTENEVLKRISRMKSEGLIRRIGGIMDSNSLGFYSTLCAAEVPAEKVDEVAAVINANPGVTHNYLRDHRLNIWFTLTCKSRQDVLEQIKKMEELILCKIIPMPTKKMYKIKVSFDVGLTDED